MEPEDTAVARQRLDKRILILDFIKQANMNDYRCLFQEAIETFVIDSERNHGKPQSYLESPCILTQL
jgi:hypothetical protein